MKERLFSALITSLIGWGCGLICGRIVWEMIYGVGSSVVQDWEYVEYMKAVYIATACLGAPTGLAFGLKSLWAALALPLVYGVSMIIFFVFSYTELMGTWLVGLIP